MKSARDPDLRARSGRRAMSLSAFNRCSLSSFSVAILCMDDVDAKFKRNFVAALHTISPGLAATHATRLRREKLSVPSPLHCARCGHLSVTTRVAAAQNPRSNLRTSHYSKRKNKDVVTTRPSKRGPCITKLCSSCGFSEVMRLAVHTETNIRLANTDLRTNVNERAEAAADLKSNYKENEPQDERYSKSKVSASNAKDSGSRPSRTSQPNTSSSSVRQPPASSKKSKKSGLQEMLARSKEKERQTENTTERHGGLAAFLVGL